MIRRLIRDHQRTLNTHDVVVGHVRNVIEGKVVDDKRTNRHPEFLQETMFQDHGTKVLITNPLSDQYLDKATEKRLRDKYEQWIDPDLDTPSH